MDSSFLKATKCMKNARKILNTPVLDQSIWFTKVEDAISLLIEASEHYVIADQMHDAGDALMEAASLEGKIKNPVASAGLYIDAAEVLERLDPDDAVTCLKSAGEIFAEQGDFELPAQLWEHVAQIRVEDDRFEEASEALVTAASNYEQSHDMIAIIG
eukprot:TRINITY_DN2621_c0_g1_i2.p1 TRINITY_DN2621_c0_g1~~TRINITY_DN2621_c0_g1_i2.p1  ORF type:complete len:158 (-),score=31.58 TRINITY_DN2621_c0_g1_i2:61-534(-)